MCICSKKCLYFGTDSQQTAGSSARQHDSHNQKPNREGDEDDDKPPREGHAKVKRM